MMRLKFMSRKALMRMAFASAGVLAAGLFVAVLSTAPVTQARDASARPVSDAAGPRCLDGQHVGRIHVVDGNTLLVYDNSDNAYKLDIGGPCKTMTDLSHLGFEFNGNSEICQAHDAQVLYSEDREAPLHCLINGVHPLTRAEAKDLDKG